jgi:hypothetical protein
MTTASATPSRAATSSAGRRPGSPGGAGLVTGAGWGGSDVCTPASLGSLAVRAGTPSRQPTKRRAPT